MTPLKYTDDEVSDSGKKTKARSPDVFPASEAPIPKVKQDVETKDAINRFVLANPRKDMAGGGMLVQPGFGGTRQGYAEDKLVLEIKEY